MITLLKSATLLKNYKFNGGNLQVTLGIEALVRAIDRLNEAAEDRLVKQFPTTSTKSCSLEEIESFSVYPYCEDTSLSLGFPGQYYSSISIRDTPTITDEAREDILNTLLCFYDLDHCKPKKNNGELMDAWRKARARQEEHQHKIFWTEAELQALEDKRAQQNTL